MPATALKQDQSYEDTRKIAYFGADPMFNFSMSKLQTKYNFLVVNLFSLSTNTPLSPYLRSYCSACIESSLTPNRFDAREGCIALFKQSNHTEDFVPLTDPQKTYFTRIIELLTDHNKNPAHVSDKLNFFCACMAVKAPNARPKLKPKSRLHNNSETAEASLSDGAVNQLATNSEASMSVQGSIDDPTLLELETIAARLKKMKL